MSSRAAVGKDSRGVVDGGVQPTHCGASLSYHDDSVDNGAFVARCIMNTSIRNQKRQLIQDGAVSVMIIKPPSDWLGFQLFLLKTLPKLLTQHCAGVFNTNKLK